MTNAKDLASKLTNVSKAPKKRKKIASLDRRKARAGYFFVLPFLIGFIAIYLPMIWDSIVYSFSRVTIVPGEGSLTEFVGWENYREALFVNPDFVKTLISGIKELAFDIPAIIIFSLFPGMQPDIVKKIMRDKKLRGVIFRTFGSGNAPQDKWLVDTLTQATRSGKTIVNITQCSTGSVKMNLYETGLQLLESGIISGHDSTVEAALTKLMFLLGKGLTPEEINHHMNLSIAGEITL